MVYENFTEYGAAYLSELDFTADISAGPTGEMTAPEVPRQRLEDV